MKRLLLAGVAALLLVTGTAHAVEYQGNLPTPVQKLPAYPPVVCVAPNWSVELCGDRQTPLPQPNPLRAFARRTPRSTTVLYDEPGGEYWAHWRRFKALADSGDDVEIRGSCASGCTVVMIHVPSDRLCFAEGASLKFHVARDPNNNDQPDMVFTERWMVNQYPQDIRAWIIAKGGVEKMNIQQMWKLDASELWDMGYRKCEKNYLPQWNIREAEREKWRKMDEKAEEAWKEWQKSRDPDFKDAAWNKRTSDAPP
jgi:hypothetical protein